jgi:transcriptional regulator with XRE-family HTH domain
MSDFGDFIRDRREALGITLRHVAGQIGVSGAYMSKMERGLDTPPSPDKIARLAGVLQVDVDHLLALANKMDPQLQQIIHKVEGLPAFLRTFYGSGLTVAELNKALEKARTGGAEGDDRA